MDSQAVPAAGTTPPGFELPNTEGDVISLARLHDGGSALLVFYRGWW
jgi:peroxiredoxin